MDIEKFVAGWLAAGNRFDKNQYLTYYTDEAKLEDISLGTTFVGHEGIGAYFTEYFIGYETQTRLLKLNIGTNTAKLEVEFTGSFPERQIGGKFELRFRDGKIDRATADLM